MHKITHIFKLGLAYKFRKSTALDYPPYQYTIEPTNICNLKCTFCPQSDPGHRTKREKGFLSVDNLNLFLDRIEEAGGANRNLNFTLDGEPLLNNSFADLLRAASEKGYFPVFASNGVLLDPNVTEQFLETGPFRASIDFASDENIFETIRGKQGHFQRVRKNLDYLIQRAGKNQKVQLDIHDIAPFCGVDAEISLRKMRAMFPPELPGNIRFHSRQFHNFCGHLDSNSNTDLYRLCPYPWTQMAVTWSGDCVACCRDTAGKTVLGNIFKEPLENVWNGDRYRKFRQNLIDRRPDLNDACQNCDLPYSPDKKRWRPRYIWRSLFGR